MMLLNPELQHRIKLEIEAGENALRLGLSNSARVNLCR
jgi:hypothetical protein